MDVAIAIAVSGLVTFAIEAVRWWTGSVRAEPEDWRALPFARRRAVKRAVRSGRLVEGSVWEQRIAAELASAYLRRFKPWLLLLWTGCYMLTCLFWAWRDLGGTRWVWLALAAACAIGGIVAHRRQAQLAPRVERSFTANFQAGHRTSAL